MMQSEVSYPPPAVRHRHTLNSLTPRFRHFTPVAIPQFPHQPRVNAQHAAVSSNALLHFLQCLLTAHRARRMMGSGMFGGAGGAGAAGGFPAPGGTGGNGALFNPWASEAPAAAAGAGAAGSPPAAGAQGAFNPFAALGGMGGLGGLGGAGAGTGAGGQPDFQQMMQQVSTR